MWGSEFATKAATVQEGVSRLRAQPMCVWALVQLLSCYPRPRLIRKVRGGAYCASQVLDRGAQADARGAKHVLDRGV